ncbi:hypothetical protein RU98_GL002565 [Enterococcus caccae]|nr:hypothetical protein RU98_GL002565 [Enterococcus caccae]
MIFKITQTGGTAMKNYFVYDCWGIRFFDEESSSTKGMVEVATSVFVT